MAAKKTRRLTTRTRTRSRGKRPPWYARVLGTKWFLNTLFILMALGAVSLLVQLIWTRAQDSATFRVNTSQWRSPIPQYITLTQADLSARLHEDAYLAARHSIFDKDLPTNIARRYETLPFVRKVTRVDKRYPNTVRVDVEWRTPMGRVQAGEGAYLVDGDGVLLDPAIYDESKLEYPPLIIQSVAAVESVPSCGAPWPNEDVVAAAKMAEFLQPLFGDLLRMQKDRQVDMITAIDVRNFGTDAKSRILLLTAGGKVFKWGNPVGAESANEPRAATKLANLRKLYAASPNLTTYKDQPLKTWIALQWFESEIVTSDKE
jgi:hypothetical protein